MTTLAVGEEGGTPDDFDDLWGSEGRWNWPDMPAIRDIHFDWNWRDMPRLPGGGDDGRATTLAVGEEGDPGSPDEDPYEVTTMALGEEGYDGYDDYL